MRPEDNRESENNTYSSVDLLPSSNACDSPSVSRLSLRAISFSFISLKCGSSRSTSRRSYTQEQRPVSSARPYATKANPIQHTYQLRPRQQRLVIILARAYDLRLHPPELFKPLALALAQRRARLHHQALQHPLEPLHQRLLRLARPGDAVLRRALSRPAQRTHRIHHLRTRVTLALELLLLQRRARLRGPVRELDIVDLRGELLDGRREEAQCLGLDVVVDECGAVGEGQAGNARQAVWARDGVGGLPWLCAEERHVCG